MLNRSAEMFLSKCFLEMLPHLTNNPMIGRHLLDHRVVAFLIKFYNKNDLKDCVKSLMFGLDAY